MKTVKDEATLKAEREARAARKAEREAKETLHREAVAVENAKLFAEVTVNYKDRLFAMLVEYATLDNFSMYKKNDTSLCLIDNEDLSDYQEVSIVAKSYEDLYALENAENKISIYYAKVAEQERLQAVRRSARAKLTEEEANALGLM